MQNSPHFEPPGVGRRILAFCYDAVIVCAILLLATVIIVALVGSEIAPGTRWFQAYLLFFIYIYYAGFWIHRGQTVGMISWGIAIQTRAQQPLTYLQAAWRLSLGIASVIGLGSGLFWLWFDRDKLALYDRLSGTELILKPRRQAPNTNAQQSK